MICMPTNAIPPELATTRRLVNPLTSLNRCMGKNGSVRGMYDSNKRQSGFIEVRLGNIP